MRHGLVALAAPLLTLLPATVAMGATLPAMERLVARLRGSGRTIAGVYAVNTAGAMAGTLLTTFLLMPAVGFRTTLFALAAVNFLCAAAIALGPAAGEAARAPIDHRLTDAPGALRLGTTIFMTGLLGIGYEVLCVRVMAQVLETSVYRFASGVCVAWDTSVQPWSEVRWSGSSGTSVH